MGARRTVAAWSVGLVVMGTAACGGDGGTATAEGEDTGGGTCTEDRVGGSATMGSIVEPRGLDPVGQPGSAASGGIEVMALFDTLMEYDTQEQAYQPRVAESLESDAESLVWTMTLREGVTFGNGDPLTAQDVVDSIARHQAPENTQVSRGDASTISSMEVVDERTVRFTLASPYPGFPRVLATDVGMITNPRLVAERGAEGFATNPAGAGVGPYEFERYTPGEEIVYTAKDDYWGGPVCIETLRFVAIAGAQATYEALQNAELDVALMREAQVIAEAREAGHGDLSTLFNYGEGVIMNSKAGVPTSDQNVRRAVVAAMDSEAINQRVYDGTALATSALIHEDTPGLYQDGVEIPEHDPESAESLVAEAKAAGWDGSIRLLADNAPYRIEEAIAVEALLESVGFAVTVDTTQSQADVITQVVVDRDYDLALWGPRFSNENMWSVMDRQLRSTASSNYYAYADPRMDEALLELRATRTPEEQQPIVARMQEILIDNPFFASIAAVEEAIVFSDRVAGIELVGNGIVRFDKAYVTDL